MNRSAGLFLKDYNHSTSRGRVNLKRVSNIACIMQVDKDKKEDQLAEIEESHSDDEQQERQNRRDRFKQPVGEAAEGCGVAGINPVPTDPASPESLVLTDTCKGPELRTRFKKPTDTNTER